MILELEVSFFSQNNTVKNIVKYIINLLSYYIFIIHLFLGQSTDPFGGETNVSKLSDVSYLFFI